MILLDAYALLSLLRDEAAADQVDGLLREGACGVVAVNLAEVLDQLLRVAKVDPATIGEVVAPMISTALEVLPFDEGTAWRTAEVRSRHYRKKDSQLSLADCALIAAASSENPIATGDPAVLAAAEVEGIQVIDLRVN